MTVSKLYGELEKWLSPDMSCDWDNDGLMCCPDGKREVKKVLLTLDVTDGAVNKAVSGNFDLIISHHPMIFRPINSVTSPKIIKLIQNGISVMSFHTRLDAAAGGVNDTIAGIFGLKDVSRFTDDGIGVIGKLEKETSLDEMTVKIKKLLGSPYLEVIDGTTMCNKVAICGGDGKDVLSDAVKAGADTYITGSMSYNSLVDAEPLGINIITAGHYFTENPVLAVLGEKIKQITGSECFIYNCDPIRHIN